MANLFQGQPSGGGPGGQLQQPDIRQQIRANPRAYVGQIKADPAGFLRQFGITLPGGMSNPMQIAQYLYGAPPRGMMGPGRGR